MLVEGENHFTGQSGSDLCTLRPSHYRGFRPDYPAGCQRLVYPLWVSVAHPTGNRCRRAALRCTRIHIYQLQPTTNCYKLSDCVHKLISTWLISHGCERATEIRKLVHESQIGISRNRYVYARSNPTRFIDPS